MEPSLSPKLAPYLAVPDARGLIRFLEQALGGKVTFEAAGPDGRLVNAEVRIARANRRRRDRPVVPDAALLRSRWLPDRRMESAEMNRRPQNALAADLEG